MYNFSQASSQHARSWAALLGWDSPPYERSNVFSNPWLMTVFLSRPLAPWWDDWFWMSLSPIAGNRHRDRCCRHRFLAFSISVQYHSIPVPDWGTLIPVPDGISTCCCIANVHNHPSWATPCKEGMAWYSSRPMHSLWLVLRQCLHYKPVSNISVQLGVGGGEMGLWAPVLLWNPVILLLKNITKSIKTC